MTDPQQWCSALFRAIDAKHTRSFLDRLTPDATFRYGSAPVTVGRMAILQTLEGFFASVAALSHRVIDLWEVSDHLICRGEVTYTRLDGKTVTVPFCNVLTVQGELISHYEIYLDPTPLRTP